MIRSPGKKPGASGGNQQLTVMSSSFVNPISGSQSSQQQQAIAANVLPLNLFS